MAADTKDVELRIRARDYSQKTLDEVVTALNALAKAQDDQLEAAKRGESSAKALEDAYRRIEDAAKSLARQGALIKTYEQQSKALEEVGRQLEKAREAQKAFVTQLGDTQPSKEQARQLNELSRSIAQYERAQQRAQDRVNTTTDRLAEYGIAVSEVGAAQQRIVSAIGQANAALERQDAAITSLDNDVRAHRASVAEAARQEAEFAASIKSVADAQAAAAKKAREFDEERAAIASRNKQIEYERVWLGLLEQEDRKNQELAKSQADLIAFQKAMAAQKERETAERLQAIETADKERQAMRALADQLAQTARGYRAVAMASGSPARQSNLAQSLKDIADPAAAALKSIQGVEQAVEQFGQRVSAIRGPVKEAQTLLRGLSDAQKAAIQIAGQVDAYQRQIAALRSARAEYVAARQTVAQLTEQLRAGTGSNDVVQRLAGAQGQLRSAAEAMARTTDKARELREALRTAGIQTNDIAGTQKRLVAAVQASGDALNRATGAVKQFGAAHEEAGSKIDRINKGERTTLSYMQRLRGEVLALATSYIGLNATLDLVRSTLSTVRDDAKIQNRLTEAFNGDQARAAQELQYLREQADRVGFSFKDAALEYSKFLMAAREANFTVEESRYIFEQFSQAAVRTGQTQDEFRGIMLALTQMISKGKIGAEELTQQLAERLPGAAAKLAKSLNIEVAELAKRMEQGAVSSRALINLASEMAKGNATAVESAATGLVQASNRFETAKYDFMKALADAGFTEAFTNFLNRLSALLNSPAGKQLAQDLGTALSLIIDLLTLMADNFQTVKTVFGAIISLKLASYFMTLAGAAAAVVTSVRAMVAPTTAAAAAIGTAGAASSTAAGGVGLLTLAVKTLSRAVPLLAAAWAIWEVGSYVLDQFSNSAKRAREEKAKLAGGKSGGQGDWEMPPAQGTPNPGTGINADQQAVEELNKYLEKNQKKLEEAGRAARLKGAKAELEERQRIATEELRAKRDAINENVKDEKMRSEAIKKIDAQITQVRLIEQQKFNNQQAGAAESRAQKTKRLIEEVARDLSAVEDRLADREARIDPMASFATRMQARLDAVSHEYDKLRKKIDELADLNPGQGAEATARLDAFVRQRQEVERIKVQTEELQRLEKNLADVQGLRAQKLEEIQALYENGQITQEQFRQRVIDTNEVFGIGVEKAASDLKAFAESIKSILDPAAYEALISRINTVLTQNRPDRTNAQANMKSAEDALNISIERRKILLDEVQKKLELNLITSEEAAAQINQINGQYKQQIIDQTTALLAYIETLRTLTNDPAVLLQLDQLAAKVRGIKMETENTKQAFSGLAQTIIGSAAQALSNSLDGIVNTLGEIITGQKSVSDGFKSMAREAALGFAKMLRDAALYIIKLQIIKALEGSGNPYLAAIGTAMRGGLPGGVSAGTKHSGGMAGSPSGGARSFVLPPVIPKMHTGGIGALPGLSNSEVVRVLQKNEEVVTRNDPRHMLNGGVAASGRAVRNILVDDRAKVPEAMASAEGDDVMLTFLRRNKASVKQLLDN
jgi:tape measure domain-containing protein